MSIRYSERLAEAGIEPSVGSVGDSYGNALTRRSTVFTRPRSFTVEDRGETSKPWSSATLEWVDWLNNRRLLEPIGTIPPAEAEERYYAMLDAPAMAA